jgi:hypothetical protein
VNEAENDHPTKSKSDRWRKKNVFAVPNVAEERFGLDPNDYQLRLLRDPLGCE